MTSYMLVGPKSSYVLDIPRISYGVVTTGMSCVLVTPIALF